MENGMLFCTDSCIFLTACTELLTAWLLQSEREAVMLRIYHKLGDICFSELMKVYEEGNVENGRELYPDLADNLQILRAEQDFYAYLRDDFFCAEHAVYAVWEENGVYLSALRLEPFQNGLLLEALETRPGYRQRGYAKKLMDASLPIFSKPIYSHVKKTNTPSLRTHKAYGFEVYADYAVFVDGSVDHKYYTLVSGKA